MILTLVVAATLVLAGATLLPFSRHEGWWVRGLDFPRLQLLVLLLALLAAQLALLDPTRATSLAMIGVTLVCVLVQAWWILPYTRLFPVEVRAGVGVAPGARLRTLTANVLTPNRNAEGLLELVRRHAPDVLVTLESDAWWESRLDALNADYPYAIRCPLDNLYGMHVYSRLPLSDVSVEYLVEPDVPSMHALVALPSGQGVRAHFLHPAPPSPEENQASSERDAELLVVARSLAGSDQPVIVTGDLNDVAWSETTRLFRRISGLLDPRVGRGMFNTFHAGYWFLRWPLDHIFHSDHFRLLGIRRLPGFGSDHFPLLTDLVCQPRGRHGQERPATEAGDHAVAREKIDSEAAEVDDVPRPGA